MTGGSHYLGINSYYMSSTVMEIWHQRTDARSPYTDGGTNPRWGITSPILFVFIYLCFMTSFTYVFMTSLPYVYFAYVFMTSLPYVYFAYVL